MLTLVSLYPFFAAAADPTADLPVAPTTTTTTSASGHFRDVILIIGVGAVLALALFLYAYATRRNRRARNEHGSRAIYRAEKRGSGPDSKHKFRKKRRHREEFVHRNPTLGETGGLPPIRTDEPTEPVS